MDREDTDRALPAGRATAVEPVPQGAPLRDGIPSANMAFDLLIPAGATAEEVFAIVWNDTSKTRAELERCIIDERSYHAKRYSSAMLELNQFDALNSKLLEALRQIATMQDGESAWWARDIANAALAQVGTHP